MKKRDLHTIALMGLTAGLALSGQAAAEGGHEHSGIGQQIARGGCGASGCGSKSGPKENPMRNGSSFDRNNNNNQKSNGYTAMMDEDAGSPSNGMEDKGSSCSGKGSCKGLNGMEEKGSSCSGKSSCGGL